MRKQKLYDYLVQLRLPKADPPLYAETMARDVPSKLEAKMAATREWYGRSYFGNIHYYMTATRVLEEEEAE